MPTKPKPKAEATDVLTDEEIRRVFEVLELGGDSKPLATTAKPWPEPRQMVYFPLSADTPLPD